MTNIHITEADVGRKFRLRNGGEVEVIKVLPSGPFPVEVTSNNCYLSDGSFWDDMEYDLDIVERLPEEGEPSFKGKAPELVVLNELDTPTMTASDGKQYPMELFGVQQRFSDRTPPEGVDLVIYEGGGLSGNNYQYRDGRLAFFKRGELVNCLGDESEMRWALRFPAPSPAVEKVEPQIWDEYLDEDGEFFKSAGASSRVCLQIWRDSVEAYPSLYQALSAWIQHVLSQNKGES